MHWSRSSKVYHAANFHEGAYQCQSDLVPMPGVLCSLLVSFQVGKTTDSAPWHPLVKPPTVLAALHVSYAIGSLSCSRDIIGWGLEGWSWGLVLVVLPVLECELPEIEDVGVALPRLCNLDRPQQHDCYIMIARTTRRQEASLGSVASACLLLVHCVRPTLASTGGHRLAPPFSKDHCASDQRLLFPVLSKLEMKIILISLFARGGGGTGLRCYKYCYITWLQGM